MPSTSSSPGPDTLVILGTGGTIAGTAARARDNLGYTAAQRSVADLLSGLPAPAGALIEVEQVAQLDSKDMDAATWQRLARRVAHHLARPAVTGVVITHGTDTLEESAWLLHRVLAPAKPVVLVAAMRPATALVPDGPQNLLDAFAVALSPGAQGVLAVLAGRVHLANSVRKVHTYRLDAFESPEGGPLGVVEEGVLRRFRAWPESDTPPALGLAVLQAEAPTWPWVEIVTSHAGARPEAVRALVASGVQGLVVAATGNGTLHSALQTALDEARAAGVTVWLCTRCASGVLVAAGGPHHAVPAAAMSPWQARIELMLGLMAARNSAG